MRVLKLFKQAILAICTIIILVMVITSCSYKQNTSSNDNGKSFSKGFFSSNIDETKKNNSSTNENKHKKGDKAKLVQCIKLPDGYTFPNIDIKNQSIAYSSKIINRDNSLYCQHKNYIVKLSLHDDNATIYSYNNKWFGSNVSIQIDDDNIYIIETNGESVNNIATGPKNKKAVRINKNKEMDITYNETIKLTNNVIDYVVSKKRIYYISEKSVGYSLNAFDIKTLEETIICDDVSWNIGNKLLIYGDYLYYIDSNKLKRFDTVNGNSETMLAETSSKGSNSMKWEIKDFWIYPEWLIFSTYSSNYILNLKTGCFFKINSNNTTLPRFYNDKFYITQDEQVYEVEIEQDSTITIVTCNSEFPDFIGENGAFTISGNSLVKSVDNTNIKKYDFSLCEHIIDNIHKEYLKIYSENSYHKTNTLPLSNFNLDGTIIFYDIEKQEIDNSILNTQHSSRTLTILPQNAKYTAYTKYTYNLGASYTNGGKYYSINADVVIVNNITGKVCAHELLLGNSNPPKTISSKAVSEYGPNPLEQWFETVSN